MSNIFRCYHHPASTGNKAEATGFRRFYADDSNAFASVSSTAAREVVL